MDESLKCSHLSWGKAIAHISPSLTKTLLIRFWNSSSYFIAESYRRKTITTKSRIRGRFYAGAFNPEHPFLKILSRSSSSETQCQRDHILSESRPISLWHVFRVFLFSDRTVSAQHVRFSFLNLSAALFNLPSWANG